MFITKKITAADLTKGTKVTNQYGDCLTVIEVIDGLMVRVLEEYNNLYHPTKLFLGGKSLARYFHKFV